MEQQKKKWYQTWWGWLILICFWWIAAPIAIYQSKLSPKNKKIGYGIYGVFLIIIIIGSFTGETQNTLSNEGTKKQESNQKIQQPKALNKQEIENNVKAEKKRVQEEFRKYEDGHLKFWNEMTNAMKKGDIYSAYGYAKDARDSIIGIGIELNKFKCNKTGDSEFDKQCKETVELGENAYLMKQEAANKLLKWFDDFQSPKKANEAKEALEEGSKYWQAFIIKLAGLTMTEEDLKNAKTRNNNKK